MSTPLINKVAILTVATLVCGCISYGEWSQSPLPYTWCAPAKRFINESRRMHSAYAEGGDHRTLGCDGKEYRSGEPWISIEKDLARSPIPAGWPKGFDGRIKNPVDMYLVSFNPNIVILCTPTSRGRDFPSGDSKVFERPLVVGTQLSCSDPKSWVTAPGKHVEPISVVSESERTLEYQGTVIILKREGGIWFASREGK